MPQRHSDLDPADRELAEVFEAIRRGDPSPYNWQGDTIVLTGSPTSRIATPL